MIAREVRESVRFASETKRTMPPTKNAMCSMINIVRWLRVAAMFALHRENVKCAGDMSIDAVAVQFATMGDKELRA